MTLHAEAEARLGRPLTAGELAIDLAAADRSLETGKEELRAAIEAEKARAARALIRGRPVGRLRVTTRMLEALERLYRAGRAAALAETRALGIEPPLGLAEPPAELAGAIQTLRAHLAGISVRLETDYADEVAANLGQVAASAVERALIRRVPGALDAASRLVSGAYGTGLAAGYAPSLNQFPGWVYSAIMDAATCTVCRYYDGHRFDTWDAIQAVLPDGGPNPACHGDGRCRCRPVPVPPDQPAAAAEPLPDADRDFAVVVDSTWDKAAAPFARDHGMTVAEYRVAVEAMLADLSAGREVRVRAFPGRALGILADGRFKTQFETNSTAGGILDPDYRAELEAAMFGLPTDYAAARRPVYGYLEGSGEGGLTQYGNVVFRLRGVRARSTVTFTDSLASLDSKRFRPSPLDAPRATSAVPGYGTRGDPLQAKRFSDLGRYAEAQIHGGVSLDDVEEVVVTRVTAAALARQAREIAEVVAWLADPANAPRLDIDRRNRIAVEKRLEELRDRSAAPLIAELERRGIPYRVVESDNPDR